MFDELGVDHIFIDEAHYFKNLETPTKMDRVAGIQTGGSERAFDLYMKARYLGGRHPGHGVTFATGTPVCKEYPSGGGCSFRWQLAYSVSRRAASSRSMERGTPQSIFRRRAMSRSSGRRIPPAPTGSTAAPSTDFRVGGRARRQSSGRCRGAHSDRRRTTRGTSGHDGGAS